MYLRQRRIMKYVTRFDISVVVGRVTVKYVYG